MFHRPEADLTASPVPGSVIRVQLGAILASDTFSRSERLSRFLRYIVEQTLEGQAAGLKEQILACELYSKGTNFDGARDAVVRVDARRLRDKLREYYAEFPDQPVVIDLPRGGYVPSFGWNAKAVSPASVQGRSRGEPQESATAQRVGSRRRCLALAAIVGLVLMLVGVWRTTVQKQQEPAKLIPLTAYPGDENWPSLSPDGSFVAFTCISPDVATSPDICMKEVGTEAVQRLVATSAAENFPAWSPDGREIAFHRGRTAKDQGIFIVSRVGGPERKVSDTGTIVAWTPDSKSLLIRDRFGGEAFGIRQVNLETLEERWLTRPQVGAGEWSFAVSPDGNTLALIRHQRPGISDLYVMPMRGGEPRKLTDWKVNLAGPAWTADGKELIYAADNRLWRISPTAAKPGRGALLKDIPMPINHLSISRPDGGRPVRLAFHTPHEQISMRRIDLDSVGYTGAFTDITPFAPSTRRDVPGRFSPDGSKVAFTSTRGSPDYELWVADSDGSNARQLTSFGSNRVMLAQSWSPNGKWILFETAAHGNNDVYIISANGGRPRRLTSGPGIEGLPDWSKDGQWIYYLSIAPGTAFDIWRMPAQGGPAEQITKGGGSEPQLSPDGRYLFYLNRTPMMPNFGAQLMRMPVGGGETKIIHEGLSPSYWCVSERGVYFLQPEGQVHSVHLFRFSDEKTVRVGALPFQAAYVYGPGRFTVSHDGRWALVNVVDRREGDLMLLDNFR